ncbi:hypothetical protein COR50_05930 [Chitinophaga caeni]|uniref:Uncharacterized protein n=1 Tax=Chitinophaga caeni TaxID=2029983 RepID=A0A291QRW3_9BACT|nr:hypothetical protein [Chitinophaga caeni]ATL46749.1 hypothetical protein COR50_05930 [Chitinophaga caeni]
MKIEKYNCTPLTAEEAVNINAGATPNSDSNFAYDVAFIVGRICKGYWEFIKANRREGLPNASTYK